MLCSSDCHDVVVWSALLGACRTYGNLAIGKQTMKQLLEWDDTILVFRCFSQTCIQNLKDGMT